CEIADEGQNQIEFIHRIEHVCRAQQIAARALHRQLRSWWRTQSNRAHTNSSSRQLAVIGGGIAGSRLVLCLHLIELSGSLKRAATPVGGAPQHDGIVRAFVDFGKMPKRRYWIR